MHVSTYLFVWCFVLSVRNWKSDLGSMLAICKVWTVNYVLVDPKPFLFWSIHTLMVWINQDDINCQRNRNFFEMNIKYHDHVYILWGIEISIRIFTSNRSLFQGKVLIYTKSLLTKESSVFCVESLMNTIVKKDGL